MDQIEFALANTSAKNFGYRMMTEKLRSLGLVVCKNTVRLCLKCLDPEGVYRSQHWLRRRTYVNNGPNYLWHLDGYDKLKPYGFCIHGAIDGYSRKIIWLEVATTNNDPSVVGSYFLNIQSITKMYKGRSWFRKYVRQFNDFWEELEEILFLELKVSFMVLQHQTNA